MNKQLLSITIAICLSSCSDNSTFLSEKAHRPDRPVLQLATRTFALHSLRWEEAFEENATLDVYVVAEHSDKIYQKTYAYPPVKAKAVRQADGRIQWKTDRPVPLDARPVRVYICYPYQSPATFFGAGRPLRISPVARYTPDYRHGRLTRGHKSVNRSCPYALMSMQHLLSLLSFRLVAGEGRRNDLYLQAVQVGNSPGHTAFCQEALLDIFTGRLTASPTHPGATVYRPHEPIPLSDTFSTPCNLRVLPLAKPVRKGEIEVLFTVNGKTYRYSFPSGTFWEKGYEYRYDFRLSGDRLSLVQTTRIYM